MTTDTIQIILIIVLSLLVIYLEYEHVLMKADIEKLQMVIGACLMGKVKAFGVDIPKNLFNDEDDED